MSVISPNGSKRQNICAYNTTPYNTNTSPNVYCEMLLKYEMNCTRWVNISHVPVMDIKYIIP
jgi:hypothetical protein